MPEVSSGTKWGSTEWSVFPWTRQGLGKRESRSADVLEGLPTPLRIGIISNMKGWIADFQHDIARWNHENPDS